MADLVDQLCRSTSDSTRKSPGTRGEVRGEFRISVLSTLEVNSSQRCEYIVQRSVNSMLSHLHSTLVELLDQVRDAS
ncbi:MAG: hypothetical protein U5N53_18485 [Mycobacterium sp.]|nr:hypothetical protein [Mycobacterium sp.]